MATTGPPPGDDPLDNAPEPPGVERGRSLRRWVIAGAAVVVLAVGGFVGVKAVGGNGSSATAASAQNGPQGPGGASRSGGRGTFGTLQSVDGQTLTVATRNGNTTTVVTSSSTRFVKAVPGALSDIKVGDHVMARGTADGTNVAAQRVTDTGTQALGFGGGGQGRRRSGNGTPPSSVPNGGSLPANGAVATGTVKSIEGSTLVVTLNNGTTKTVTTSPSTTFSVVKASSLQELTTGQPITVQGPTGSDGTVTAKTVEQGVGGFGGGGFGGGQGRPGGAPGSGTGGN
jgi:hypothetical protein